MPMGEDPARAIRLLIVEDVKADAERALYQLGRAGLDCVWRRVETEQELVAALAEFEPTVILSDFSLPQFDGMSALGIARVHAPGIPFIFLSGTIGEETAIEALHAGAVDYVLKETWHAWRRHCAARSTKLRRGSNGRSSRNRSRASTVCCACSAA